MKLKTIAVLNLLSLLLLFGCSAKSDWQYQETISLNEISPLGLAHNHNTLWISAPDQKKVLQIDIQGNILKEYPDLERPMHIASYSGKVFAPIYLEDRIEIFSGSTMSTLELDSLPDAPAGISVKGDTVAVADFFNHRIILQTEDKTVTIGEEGHANGQLYYPTDVELVGNKIYVADAYNNRVQVFDSDGNSLQIIGAQDSINVATGLTVYDNQLFVADYYNNRILVYDINGIVSQIFTNRFVKPTEIIEMNGDLLIANYGKNSIVKYSKK